MAPQAQVKNQLGGIVPNAPHLFVRPKRHAPPRSKPATRSRRQSEGLAVAGQRVAVRSEEPAVVLEVALAVVQPVVPVNPADQLDGAKALPGAAVASRARLLQPRAQGKGLLPRNVVNVRWTGGRGGRGMNSYFE